VIKPPPGRNPPPILAHIDTVIGNFQRLHRAGATILAATDAGIFPGKPHDVLPHGIAELPRLGHTAAEALRAATSDAAQVCGLGHRKGRIAPGYDADLLAVNGNPLDDLATLLHPIAVYRQGERITHPSR
jgi:imidazolonepropionase-like amidohydrolase